MRIPNDWLDAVVFLYETEQDAEESSHIGGTGFLMGVPAESGVPGSHPYVVTNAHVARTCPVVRVRRPGGVSTVTYDADEWVYHPDLDDVAVAPFPVPVTPRLISLSYGLSESQFADLDLGPGDDVFILGRFVGLDGRLENTPTARFGQLAMRSVEKVINDFNHLSQDSHIVEMRTLTGYSGSPVFATIAPMTYGPYAAVVRARQKAGNKSLRKPGTWLLGIEWGNLHRYQRVREKIGEGRLARYAPVDEPWWVRENSGMSCVVPAWKITEVLMDERLRTQRSNTEKLALELRDARSGSSASSADEKENLASRDFEKALRNVSRRKPSQHDEAAPGTSE